MRFFKWSTFKKAEEETQMDVCVCAWAERKELINSGYTVKLTLWKFQRSLSVKRAKHHHVIKHTSVWKRFFETPEEPISDLLRASVKWVLSLRNQTVEDLEDTIGLLWVLFRLWSFHKAKYLLSRGWSNCGIRLTLFLRILGCYC